MLLFQVEVGAPDGHKSRLRGEGEPHMDGEPGDLIFVFHTERHPQFTRKLDDLYTNVTISLQVSMCNTLILFKYCYFLLEFLIRILVSTILIK